MNDLAEHIVSLFEFISNNLSSLKDNLTPELQQRLDNILSPIFTDPTSCKFLTDCINQLGDFSENVLNPLLEQYLGETTATKVKFALEDLLVSIEKYRDYHLKKLDALKQETEASKIVRKAGNFNVIPGIKTNSFGGRITTQYRLALNSESFAQSIKKQQHNKLISDSKHHTVNTLSRNFRKLENKDKAGFNTLSKRTLRNFKEFEFNKNSSFKGLQNIEKEAEILNIENGASEQKVAETMCCVLYDEKKRTFIERIDMEKPKINKAGQVLVKIIAVSLGNLDFRNITNDNTHSLQKNLANFQTSLSTNFATLKNSLKIHRSATQVVAKNKNSKDNLVGLGYSFCGIVSDIAWTPGTHVHLLPVSLHQKVFGVLSLNSLSIQNGQGSTTQNRQVEESGRAVVNKTGLAEYVVCDIENLARVQSNMSDEFSAAFALDGSTVCKSLASSNLSKYDRVLVLNSTSFLGLTLLQLLINDLNLSRNNILCLIHNKITDKHELDLLINGFGILPENIYDANDILLTSNANNNTELEAFTQSETENYLMEKSVDEIFDCFDRVFYETLSKEDLKKFTENINKKLKSEGQLMKLDTEKLLYEKTLKNSGWQKELNFLNSKFNAKMFRIPNSDKSAKKDEVFLGNVSHFSSENIENEFEKIKTGKVLGKSVIKFEQSDIENMKQRRYSRVNSEITIVPEQ